MIALFYNILNGNLYSINNFFTYRSDAINFIINARGHDFKLFIIHVDYNENKYFLCIHTVLMLNLLPRSDEISARNTKLFYELLLNTYVFQLSHSRVLR